MKKVNFTIMFFVCLWVLCVSAIVSNAQTSVKTDSTGNYIAISVKGQKTGSKAVATGKYFTDSKGVKYPVYKSVNGKLFYTRVSKSGNKYNVYLTISK
jgi:hypothetical protein